MYNKGIKARDIITKDAIMNALTVDTVSYTHLDVYKRQAYGRISLCSRVYKEALACLSYDEYLDSCLLYTSHQKAVCCLTEGA